MELPPRPLLINPSTYLAATAYVPAEAYPQPVAPAGRQCPRRYVAIAKEGDAVLDDQPGRAGEVAVAAMRAVTAVGEGTAVGRGAIASAPAPAAASAAAAKLAGFCRKTAFVLKKTTKFKKVFDANNGPILIKFKHITYYGFQTP